MSQVARALVPAGRGVIQLVHHHRRSAAEEKEQAERGVGHRTIAVIPGAVLLLKRNQIVRAAVEPVGVAEEFAPTGSADPLDAVERVTAAIDRVEEGIEMIA